MKFRQEVGYAILLAVICAFVSTFFGIHALVIFCLISLGLLLIGE